MTVGHDGEPSGRLILGQLAFLGSTSIGGVAVEVVVVTAVVIGISSTSTLSLSRITPGIS